MKDMKLTAKQAKRETMPMEPQAPKYPYGLSVHLDNDSLDNLEVKSLPTVGDTFEVLARAEVKAVESRDQQGGGKRREVTLQITHMEMAPKAKDGKEAKDKIFTESGK